MNPTDSIVRPQPALAARDRSGPASRDARRQGVTLLMVTLMLAFLSIVAAVAFYLASTDLSVSSNYRKSTAVFMNADAGARYTLAKIRAALATGSLHLTGSVANVNFSSPAGFLYEPVTRLTRLADRQTYVFTVTSRLSSARAALETAFFQPPLLAYGVFADGTMDLKSFGGVYNYYSEDTAIPTPLDSNESADIAANGSIITRQNTVVDGDLIMGSSAIGNPATWIESPLGGSTINGATDVYRPRIAPDPLGATSGVLAAQFAAVQSANDNAAIGLPTAGGTLTGDTTLPAGDYFLQGIAMGSGETITIDDSAGPVTIYLDGPATFSSGSIVNSPSTPRNLTIYSRSNQPIGLFNSSSFAGTIYAPYSSVEIKNSGLFYGVLWCSALDVKNGADLYIDLTTLHSMKTNDLTVVAWRDVRD
jgi:hypothetical protein